MRRCLKVETAGMCHSYCDRRFHASGPVIDWTNGDWSWQERAE